MSEIPASCVRACERERERERDRDRERQTKTERERQERERLTGMCEIPARTRLLYKTAWEIKQRVLIDMAADRFVCVCVCVCL